MQLISHKKEKGAEIFTYVPIHRLKEFQTEVIKFCNDQVKKNDAKLTVLPCMLSKEINLFFSLDQIGVVLQNNDDFLNKKIQIQVNGEQLGKKNKMELFKLFQLLKIKYDISISSGANNWYYLELTHKNLKTIANLTTTFLTIC